MIWVYLKHYDKENSDGYHYGRFIKKTKDYYLIAESQQWTYIPVDNVTHIDIYMNEREEYEEENIRLKNENLFLWLKEKIEDIKLLFSEALWYLKGEE